MNNTIKTIIAAILIVLIAFVMFRTGRKYPPPPSGINIEHLQNQIFWDSINSAKIKKYADSIQLLNDSLQVKISVQDSIIHIKDISYYNLKKTRHGQPVALIDTVFMLCDEMVEARDVKIELLQKKNASNKELIAVLNSQVQSKDEIIESLNETLKASVTMYNDLVADHIKCEKKKNRFKKQRNIALASIAIIVGLSVIVY